MRQLLWVPWIIQALKEKQGMLSESSLDLISCINILYQIFDKKCVKNMRLLLWVPWIVQALKEKYIDDKYFNIMHRSNFWTHFRWFYSKHG